MDRIAIGITIIVTVVEFYLTKLIGWYFGSSRDMVSHEFDRVNQQISRVNEEERHRHALETGRQAIAQQLKEQHQRSEDFKRDKEWHKKTRKLEVL